MYLAHLSWPQLLEVPRDAIVLLPLAGCEQHSRHLPFGTDAIVLEAILDRLDAVVGGMTLILPIQPVGYAGQHLPFKGSLSVPPATYVDALVSLADEMAGAGFGRLLFLNAQYGNEPPLGLALRALRERRAGFAAVAASYWTLLDREATHAAELETSLMLHLRPELVRVETIARDGIASASQFAPKVLQYPRMDQCSHHGGMGDPEAASSERGERLLDEITDALAGLVRDFHDGFLTG